MAGISDLVAAQLAKAAYPNNPLPQGWTLYKSVAPDGNNSVSVFLNTTTHQAVFAFKGSDNLSNFKSDFFNSGSTEWEAIKTSATGLLAEVKHDFAGFELMTDGHSLGGAMAQTLALSQGVSGYGFNSLPIAAATITDDYTKLGLNYAAAVSEWKSSGHTFREVNVSGDPVSMYYFGQPYISTTTVKLASPYAACEAAGVASSFFTTTIGTAVVAYCAGKAHAIDTSIQLLGSGSATGDTAAVDAQLTANGSAIANDFANAILTSSNGFAVTTSSGAVVTVSPISATSASDGYVIYINGQGSNLGVITGSGGVLTQSGGNVYEFSGTTGSAVTGNSLTVSIGANTSTRITGSGDAVNASGTGDTVTIGGNGQNATGALSDTVRGTGVKVTLLDGTNANVYDSNATVTAGNNVTFGAYGSGLTVNAGTGDGVWVGSNGTNAVGAASDIVRGTPSVVTVVDSSNVTVFASGLAVNIGSNDNVGSYGSAITVNDPGTTSNLWVGQNGSSGIADRVTMGGGSVAVADDSHADIDGSPSVVIGGARDVVGANSSLSSYVFNGGWNVIYVNHKPKSVSSNGSNDIVVLNDFGSDVTVNGNNTKVDETGSYQVANINGQFDSVYLANPTDSYTCTSANTSVGSGVDPYLLHEAMGFAGSKSATKATLASPVHGNDALGRALDEVNGAIAHDVKGMYTGTLFNHPLIKWAFDGAGKHSPELAAAQSAFDAWSSASGLKFQQVGNTAAADIAIAWDKFGTATSGVVGVTSIEADANGRTSHAVVRIEDPAETTIANGTYAGTNATLAQVLAHEIGHALGLADNTDPTSVENYFLDTANTRPSADDADAVTQLYWSVEGHTGPYISDAVAAAIAVLATFAPATGNSAVHLVGNAALHPANALVF